MRVLPFEDDDPSLVPMAGRRALDAAGLKLSLRGWRSLSLRAREALVAEGGAAEVDAERVRALLDGADPAPTPIGPIGDPSPDAPPDAVTAALGAGRPLSADAWSALGPLERYVLANYAARGRVERLHAAYDALVKG